MTDDAARETWLLMSDLVLNNMRRRAVSEALGMSFGRTRAIRRLARQPMSMREFATAMDIDPPNATVLVADLESQGIVATPPEGLTALSPEDLEALRRILEAVGGE
jgi:hypothetical protein